MTTAMLFFLLKKNLDFYGTMCHILIDGTYQIQCSYETVVRFFHKQGDALKMPQPWPDKQDEQLREAL